MSCSQVRVKWSVRWTDGLVHAPPDLCGEEGAESESKAFVLPIDLRSMVMGSRL